MSRIEGKQLITSGAATVLGRGTAIALVNPAALLPIHAITLPVDPVDRQEVTILFGGTIEAGQTVVGALSILPNVGHSILQTATPTIAVSGDCVVYWFDKPLDKWYKKTATKGEFEIIASTKIVSSTRNVLAGDVVNAHVTANTLADVTGLSFPVIALQRYKFYFFIMYNAAATTTGSRWTINFPAATTVVYHSNYTLTSNSKTFNEGLTAVNLPAAANASSLLTGNIAIIQGIIIATVSGTVIARFASEITASAITAKAGSYVTFEIY